MRYLTLLLGVISVNAMASFSVGTSTVLGSYANRQSLITSLSNPAAPYLMTNVQSLRVGFLGPLSLGYEMSDVSDLEDQVDQLEVLLERNYSDPVAANSAREQANSIIADIGSTSYVKFSGALQVPFMPIVYKTANRGAFTLDASAAFVSRAEVIADDIFVNGGEELASDTAVYLKRATDYRFGLGYSQLFGRPVSGALILGGKLNVHSIALGQKLSFLTNEDDNGTDVFGDFLTNRDNAQSGISLDLGAIWTAPNYQLGVAATSINEPEFDFDALGDCRGLSGSDLSNCNGIIRLSDKGKLALNETYKMDAQLTVDAAVMSTNQNWSLAGSYDVNSVSDPVGDKQQWAVVSLSYFSDNLYFPGIRVGYRKNQEGSKLSYATVGATFFRRLDFDVAYGLERQKGETLPRSLYLSLGYNFAF